MPEQLSISTELNATALEVYNAWLDAEKHSDFTGGEANIKNEINSEFTAWDEYISGKNLELEKGKRILQSWRTAEFSQKDEDSLLEVLLEDFDKGQCKITIHHSNLGEGGAKKYSLGWEENYFQPMREYFK